MENRLASTVTFKDFFKAIDVEAKKVDIDLRLCDVFEDFLLDSAGIEEKSAKSYFGYPSEQTPSNCIFCCAIDYSVMKKLLALNESIPELKLEDITYEINKKESTTIPKHIDNQPTIIFKAELLGLKRLIPLFIYFLDALKKNQDTLNYYRSFPCSPKFMHEKLTEFFATEGMCLKETPILTDMLLRLCVESPKRAKTAKESLSPFLIPPLVNIVLRYLNVSENQAEFDLEKPWTTTHNYLEAESLAEKTTLYFEGVGFNPDSFINYFFPMQTEPTKLTIKKFGEIPIGVQIDVENRSLLHPGLLSDVIDAINQLPEDVCDSYRKKSETIRMTRKECKETLKKVLWLFAKQKNTKTIIEKINQILVETEPEKLNAYMTELRSELMELPLSYNACLRLFRKQSDLVLAVRLTHDALNALDRIINKKFHEHLISFIK